MVDKDITEELVTPEGGAVAGGITGAILGTAAAGPIGLVAGAAIGAVAGVVVGKSAGDDLRPQILYADGDLEHFREHFKEMPYYIEGLSWDDYEPAYRFAIDEYLKLGRNTIMADVEPEIGDRWMAVRGASRLTWAGARLAVIHLWEGYDEGADPLET